MVDVHFPPFSKLCYQIIQLWENPAVGASLGFQALFWLGSHGGCIVNMAQAMAASAAHWYGACVAVFLPESRTDPD